MSRKWYAWIGLGAVAFLGFFVYVCNTAEFRLKHPRFPDAVIKVTADGAIVQKQIQLVSHPSREASPREPQGPPTADVTERTFDFGYMDPLTQGRHAFVVRNTGKGLLDLQVKDTTCKCTVAGAKDRVVPPGGETTVELSWNTGRQPLYSHSATIVTNDPELPEFRLQVQGKIRRQLACSPEFLAVGGIAAGAKAVATTIVYSQVWESLEIVELKSQALGMILSAQWLDAEQIPSELDAKCAYRITAQAPEKFSVQGAFQDVVSVRVLDVATEEEETLSIPLQGRVLRTMSLYGPAIGEDGEIDLGLIAQATGTETNLLVKIRDDQRELGDVRVECSAPQVKASLTPRGGGESGLYTLKLKVPANAVRCNHLATELRATLTIRTEHPRIGTQRFPIRFAVD
jgi:hypothetical protein